MDAVVAENTTIETDKKPDESIENIRKTLKPIKSALIDLFVSIARVIFFWLPGGDLAKGQALMIFHFIGGCILYTIYFTLPHLHSIRLFIFFFFVIVIIQQIVFRGCMITKAEQQLTGSKDTILDPWIRLAGFEPSRELRVVCNISVVGCMSMTLLMTTILEQLHFF